ncbi:MAG: HNH endonuclease [Caulobacteraceae bacterium]|nr:HNH endonuclease [Caulobacteraceae bacterium]
MLDTAKIGATKRRKANPKKHRQWVNTWQSRNVEKVRKHKREYFRKYYSKNAPRFVAYSAARRQRVRDKTVCSRGEIKTINSIYETSKRITKCTGIQFHVDHIKPLSKGGMHIPNNLQILPAKINLQKSDKEF